ncbi:MAG: hypothetical protein EZS28_029707 [Streblomastix strix]|uniref:Uncharacterized protein n=1 Tax=Streblomastix strix TaxID=222440 RepID=A0A5J4UWU4_9EUKA|nr:MAG: hypothetical protein EZS28_029707 [Streblomastix strix]
MAVPEQAALYIKDLSEMYARAIDEVDAALNGGEQQSTRVKKNADPQGCFSGEVDIDGWLSQTECLDRVKNDPNSIYGYRCEASKNRNPDGTRSIGKFVRTADGCIFSNCRPGYNRKWDKCVKDIELPGEDPDEIWPATTEKEYLDQLMQWEIPYPIDPILEEEKKTNAWLIVGIIFIVLTVLLIVALVVVIVICIIRSGNKKNDNNDKRVEMNERSQNSQEYNNPLYQENKA